MEREDAGRFLPGFLIALTVVSTGIVIGQARAGVVRLRPSRGRIIGQLPPR